MPLISYADNMEDVLLARALGATPEGCYIDVGAGSPTLGSVTCHFYESGWRGVNIEPQPALHAELLQARREDVCLRVVLGARSGRTVLYQNRDNWGLATTSATQAARYRDQGMEIGELDVEVMTLADVCREYVQGPIDFCKIDAEGQERAVLLGGDWERWRPRIVVAEATVPMSRTRTDHLWRDVLLAHRYREAYFDGLNAYFVAEEAAELAPLLALQPNWFDEVTPYREVLLQRQVAELESAVAVQASGHREAAEFAQRLEAHAQHLEQVLQAQLTNHQGQFARIAELERRNADLEQDNRAMAQEHAALAQHSAALEQDNDALRRARSVLEAEAENLRPAAEELSRVRQRSSYILVERITRRTGAHPSLQRWVQRVTRRLASSRPRSPDGDRGRDEDDQAL
jgi:FkbM family methyltransferase